MSFGETGALVNERCKWLHNRVKHSGRLGKDYRGPLNRFGYYTENAASPLSPAENHFLFLSISAKFAKGLWLAPAGLAVL